MYRYTQPRPWKIFILGMRFFVIVFSRNIEKQSLLLKQYSPFLTLASWKECLQFFLRVKVGR